MVYAVVRAGGRQEKVEVGTIVTMDRIKADKRLAGMVLARQPRLSVQPVTDAEWRLICKMGGLG